MPWPRLLVLVRHAESEGNVLDADRRAALEIPTHAYKLTPRGREQARLTGEYLRAQYGAFDIHYTSYYERARETMRLMAPEARVYEDPRLAEAQRGIYHTYTRAEVERHFPKEIERKEREGLYHHRPLGGENWLDIELRIHSFLGTLARDYGDRKVLIVTHGHWLILFQRLVDRFDIPEAERRYRADGIPNASVTVYEGGDGRLKLSQVRPVPWLGRI